MKLSVIALAIFALTAPVKSEEQDSPPADKARAELADNQDAAILLSRSKDLPALKKADRLIFSHKLDSGKSVSVEVADEDALRSIRSLLTVKKVTPSSGIPWAHVRWFTGDELIRVIWVMENGEWGFYREGTSYSVGLNTGLVKFLKVLSSEKKADKAAEK